MTVTRRRLDRCACDGGRYCLWHFAKLHGHARTEALTAAGVQGRHLYAERTTRPAKGATSQ